ncbi:hypothetical protein, conserved [Eimeria tenella]|uniref:Uncharacterized protein n=1 Tax=Eimeria tenella TaxID=5802 RepID=U6KZ28_EIMTE|nr:hypothetical protein, conserved [Eimeria tenella]CDJ41574.1 hypothetical protein, conserved [Eimeria tenella]|eukprot:XP_013232324.1 hypothetical protein, conserved [Eimeria tenella]
MNGQDGAETATFVPVSPDPGAETAGKTPQARALVKSGADNPASDKKQKNAFSRFYEVISTKRLRVDSRIRHLFGMSLSIAYAILALWVVTYKECPLDDLGNPIPDYHPPQPCVLDDMGEKVDPDCIDPPDAYARVENICYMYLVNEFALHVTYVLYVKVWTLGGRSVGFWKEMSGYIGYFVVEFILNAAPYHIQTFPEVREVLPFLNTFTWPLYAAFIFGSILLIPLGVYLATTKDQARRALTFHLPGIIFFGVDVFNRTVFSPVFDTMQHKFAQLQLSAIISFVGELAVANFYGSIFLPGTHKATVVMVEFGYNLSYQVYRELPSVKEGPTEELLPQENEENEDGVRALLEGLDGPESSNVLKQSSENSTSGLGARKSGHSYASSNARQACTGERKPTSVEGSVGGDADTYQRTRTDRYASATHQRGGRTSEQRSRNSRLGSRASTFSAAARQSRVLAPILASVEHFPPREPYVPVRPDGPDPLELDKIICCFSIIWDAWRYLLIRNVLMKASSIYLYLLMILKDFAFSYWHFGYAFTERKILSAIEGTTAEEHTFWDKTKAFLVKAFQEAIVRPFFLTNFLSTTVWRTEVIFGMNEKRQNYSNSVYGEPRSEPQEDRVSFRKTFKHAGARKPTASDWAYALSTVAVQKTKHTKGFLGSLCSDLWALLVLTVRRDWRHWKENTLSRYKHPVEHWKKRLSTSKGVASGSEKLEKLNYDDLELRYHFANECCIIRHVPAKPKTPKRRSSSQIPSMAEELQRPSGQSVFRRINAVWLSKVVKEIQSCVYNRCWPRLLQKLISSAVLVATELFAENSTVGLLPSYQQYGLFRDPMGRFRVIFIFVMDIAEVSSVWYTQAQSRFYQSIKYGYNLFHNFPMILLCSCNCAAQVMNFAMVRYIRFAPICGDKRVLPENVKQDMLMHLNLVKHWDQPEM